MLYKIKLCFKSSLWSVAIGHIILRMKVLIRSSFDFKTKVSLYFKTYDADEIISKLNKSAIG